jgi:putative FmdB family regulatory protein
MPVYVYRNLRTGETFELKQRMTDPVLTAHPESGDPLKRLIQPVGIAFKGSGFYVNDSRKQPTKQAAKKPTTDQSKKDTPAASGASTAKDTASGGTKPAEKSKKEGSSGAGSSAGA